MSYPTPISPTSTGAWLHEGPYGDPVPSQTHAHDAPRTATAAAAAANESRAAAPHRPPVKRLTRMTWRPVEPTPDARPRRPTGGATASGHEGTHHGAPVLGVSVTGAVGGLSGTRYHRT